MFLPEPGQVVRIIEIADFGAEPSFTHGQCVQVDCAYWVRKGPAGNAEFLRPSEHAALDARARKDPNLWTYVRAVGQGAGGGTICRVEPV